MVELPTTFPNKNLNTFPWNPQLVNNKEVLNKMKAKRIRIFIDIFKFLGRMKNEGLENDTHRVY